MNKTLHFVLYILFAAVTTSSLPAQERDWNIFLTNGDTVRDCSLEFLLNDTLCSKQSEKTIWVPIAHISTLCHKHESKFWSGAGYGLLFGAVTGGVIGLLAHGDDDDSFLNFGPEVYVIIGAGAGGTLGTTAGGIIGALQGNDDVYDLSSLTMQEKASLIQQLMAKR